MWTLALQVVLQLIGFVLEKNKASAQLRALYIKLVMQAQADGLGSVKLHKSYEDQLKELESQEAAKKPTAP